MICPRYELHTAGILTYNSRLRGTGKAYGQYVLR
ncbi:hypothetical protein NVI2019_PEGOAJLN_00629 [Providencia alcalifaciens]|nr:hypothetical protein NVI2019_PLFLNFOB_00628 [Providencia alcalifaciens]CAG9410421.1 hypothetical protein NVI2019_OHEONHNH_00628 [Providencia alcalifaciens]CAG9410626.1 hypothetical protein NVI2019_NGLDDFDA_00622 [Providencia alcalifaciens]CAG9410630.1 hypothetical protein NVI2019_KOLGMIGM_00629 [Providencia alcalifaciens]CAG9410738.1 hypothetical protein NVI2019_PEGOAJLN_00629 [Providencia alcalifaciens]